MRSQYCYSLYARDHGFLLKTEGEDDWQEFATIFDAVIHIENLPESDGSTLSIHNQLGHRIGQLLLSSRNLRVKPFPGNRPKRMWSHTSPVFRNSTS
jgi:hypothetical protein